MSSKPNNITLTSNVYDEHELDWFFEDEGLKNEYKYFYSYAWTLDKAVIASDYENTLTKFGLTVLRYSVQEYRASKETDCVFTFTDKKEDRAVCRVRIKNMGITLDVFSSQKKTYKTLILLLQKHFKPAVISKDKVINFAFWTNGVPKPVKLDRALNVNSYQKLNNELGVADNYGKATRAVLDKLIPYKPKRSGELFLFTGVPGCQPAGQLVLMANGSWKKVEDIKKGDSVVSPQKNGQAITSEVLKTVKYSKKNVYKIQTSGEREPLSYIASEDHILPIIELPIKKISGKTISGPSTLTEMTVSEYLKKSNSWKKKARLFTSPASDFPEQKFEIHPYVVGAFLGDGCLSGPIVSITSAREEIFKAIESHGIQLGKRTKDSRSKAMSCRAIKKDSDLLKKVLGTSKSYFKRVPDKYLKGSLAQRLELLAGLIDTDGTSREFSSTSKQLANDFIYLVRSVGGVASLTSRITSYETGPKAKKFKSYRVGFSFCEHTPSLVLSYKNASRRNMDWKNPRNRNFKVQKLSKKDVFGFTLTGDSQWYVTNDWIVTHNCGKTNLIRTLAWEWRDWADFNYIMDASSLFSDPRYLINVLFDERSSGEIAYKDLPEDFNEDDLIGIGVPDNTSTKTKKASRWKVVILEDAGEMLTVDAKMNVGNALSVLFNATDGLLGQGINIMFIITTNEELGNLHPALKRSGRCTLQHEFEPLSKEEAQEWLKTRGKDPKLVDDRITLADLYELTKDSPFKPTSTKPKQGKIGFGKG